MDISWFGKSSVLLRVRTDGTTLLVDPHKNIKNADAKAILISAETIDERQIPTLKEETHLINGPGEFELGSAYITGMGISHNRSKPTVVPISSEVETSNENDTESEIIEESDSFEDDTSDSNTEDIAEVESEDSNASKQGGFSTIFLIRAENLSVCLVGSIKRAPSARQLAELRQAEIIIAPIAEEDEGMPTNRLAELIRSIDPRVFIPLNLTKNQTSINTLIEELGISEENIVRDQARLSVTDRSLPLDMRINILSESK